ncbi:MAG: plasmid stabilization system protein [Phycisphaerales bacterium]|jgi:toxin ParE1/3/4|nr:plasmid stabilization system protein [Phycisphaerales bacterium]
MPRLIVHDRAKADLDDIADYIARDSIDAALRFYQAAREAFERLADFPGAGGRHPTGNPAFDNLRIWPITGFRNYLVCYFPMTDGAEILRVVHGARDIDRVFK